MARSEGTGGRAGCFGPVAWEAMLDSECVWGWSVFCLFVGCSEASTSIRGSVAGTAAASWGWGCEELCQATTQQLISAHAKWETSKRTTSANSACGANDGHYHGTHCAAATAGESSQCKEKEPQFSTIVLSSATKGAARDKCSVAFYGQLDAQAPRRLD